VLFVVLSGSDDDDATRSAASRPQSAVGTTAAQPAKPQTSTRDAAPKRSTRHARRRGSRSTPEIKQIVIRGGKVVGGVKRLEYERGERVRFSVRSDVADEVHVHGFDVTKDVPAKGSVRFEFSADIEGVFGVELHHSGMEIAELGIRP
jgi:hypothetical protein